MTLSAKRDLDPLMFDGDKQTREQLMGDAEFAAAAKKIADKAPCVSARRALLANALKLNKKIAPDAFSALRRARKALGVQGDVELFCIQQPELNAFVTEATDGRVLIALSSAALQALDKHDLTFVIGHELGHALLDHLSLHPQGFADSAHIAPVHMARLYAWMRYAELSADRVGLFCCRDYDVAVRVSFMMTSGLTDARFLDNAAECAAQYAELSAEQMESSADDWFSTHPYSPLRLRALDLFARSQTFHSMTGSDAGELGEVALEHEVQAIMSLMDPTFLNESAELDDVRDFLALAGYWVAIADDQYTHDEQEVLDRLLAQAGPAPNRDHIRNMSDRQMRRTIKKLGSKLALSLSPNRKHKMMEDLLAVAMADMVLHDAELDALVDISQLLGADSMSVSTTLLRVENALD